VAAIFHGFNFSFIVLAFSDFSLPPSQRLRRAKGELISGPSLHTLVLPSPREKPALSHLFPEMPVRCQEENLNSFLGDQEQPLPASRRGVTRMALGALVGQGGKGGSIKIHFRPFVYLIEKLVPNGGKKCATGDCF